MDMARGVFHEEGAQLVHSYHILLIEGEAVLVDDRGQPGDTVVGIRDIVFIWREAWPKDLEFLFSTKKRRLTSADG